MGSRNNKPGRIVKGTAPQPSLKSASGVWSLDEAMQAHRVNAWPQPNLFQPVSNSLRLNGSRQTSLSRTISRSGNQQTWTWSGWFKPSTTTGSQYLFVSTNTNGNPFTYLYFSNAVFRWWDNTGAGTYGAVLNTSAVYRDINAWYHVVLAVDTTQSTEANRAKLYINGVQVTSFTATSYPLQGEATYTNSNASGENVAYISAAPGYVYGYLAEVNFVDGYQLDPSLLGKFDTNNTWVPIPYTGSYGTNGFYLPFTNAVTSQTLGYDASLTGTTTYDADQDPYRGSVALHLTGNGPAGGNNNVFADSGPNNYAVTRNGIVTQGSFSPFPFNTNTPYNPATHGASAYFNGTSDWLATPQNANFTFDANFTIEFWVYISTNQNADLVATATNVVYLGGGNSGWVIAYYTSGGIRFGYQASSSWVVDNALGMTPALNAWNHIAVVRSGSTITGYLNGAAGTTPLTSSATFTSNLYGPYVGAGAGNQGHKLGGYVSGLRIIKGAAVYTAAFTPTMRPFGTLTNNLIAFSEDFSNASWTIDGTGATSAFNASVAPDGTPSATLAREGTSAAGGARTILTSPWSTLSATTFTFSMYVKKYGQKRNIFMLAQESANAFYAHFDIVAGTVVNASNSGTGTYTGSGITDVGNGWFRIWITGSITSSAIYTMVTGEAVGSTGFNAGAYTGDGSSGYLVWGAQLETASSPSNYTPTPANFSTAPSLLLNFANSAVTDTAGGDNILTGSTATITNASKYGSGAMTFNGTSDFVAARSTTSYTFGTANFTIEYWVYFNSVAATQCVAAAYDSNGADATSPAAWTIRSNGVLGWEGYFGSTSYVGTALTPTATVTANTWHHVATVRNNGEIIAFLNGRVVGRVSVGAAAVAAPGGGVHIGRAGLYNGQFFNGSVDDFRVTKGVARYTTDFAPPARALPEVGGKSFVTTNVNAGVVQRFTATGTTSWTAPSDVTSVEVLVVGAGGGGGGDQGGGGGGAGGVIYNNQYAVTPGQTYTVVVGAGGAGDGTRGSSSSSYFFGATGGNSQFGSLIASGGGGGASMIVQTSPYTESRGDGRPGGSGGGASNWQSTTTGLGGAGTAGQGFDGGSSTVASGQGHIGGGGGGVGAAGGNATNPNPGAGGAGLSFGILGTPYYFAGGGGGGCYYVTAGVGGIGGGGGGASNASTSSAGGGSALNSGATGVTGTVGGAGGANTGGGGGGAGGTGGAGGSGIVVVRYTTQAVGNSSDATSDNLVDSPTQYGHDSGLGGEVVGNYATLNPLVLTGGATLSNGNLNILGVTAYRTTPATIAMTSGKWYWENKLVTFNPSTDVHVGVCLGNFTSFQDTWVLSTAFGWGYTCQGGLGYNSSTGKNISSSVRAAGDTIGLAFDADAGNLYAYVNGVVVNGGSPIYTGLTSGPYFPFVTTGDSTGSVACNFGQRAWTYAPPAGYNAITTKNLPRPAVGSAAAAPNEYFGTILYTGNNTASRSFTGLNFRPDLVIIKDRTTANNWIWNDSVRGASNTLFSNNDLVAYTDRGVATFDSAGFTMDANLNGDLSTNGDLYVAWCWRAGGASVANTAGAITSQVSANTASGFSIVTYTGTGTQASVGHGLSAAPELIITKARNQTLGWYTYTTVIDGSMDYFLLNTNAAKGDSGLAVPTSTVFYNDGWSASYNMLAYCFHSVAGYSKIGTYTSNGSADGTFVYTGFRPAFIMIKRYDSGSTADWQFIDTTRDVVNASGLLLQPNANYTESNATPVLDFLSNGFKNRNTYNVTHASGGTYIYMAFAGKPFGNVNGTAR